MASKPLPTSQSGHATTIFLRVFFAHLLILEDPERYQTLISSSMYHLGLLHKISLEFVYNVLSNVACKQTGRQTDKTYEHY